MPFGPTSFQAALVETFPFGLILAIAGVMYPPSVIGLIPAFCVVMIAYCVSKLIWNLFTSRLFPGR
jgi:hypothetical protein